MKRALPLLAALMFASPAFAADVGAAFGNTVLTIDPDGRTRKIWLKEDGSWTGLSRRGLDLAGKWSVKGDEVCLTQSKPRLFGSLCEHWPSSFDKAITAKDPSGKTVTLKLVKGRAN